MAIDKIGTSGLVAADIVPLDGSITTAKIANDAVTSAKIGVDVIAAEDLANNSVTVAELANNAVTTDKLNAAAVTAPKISESSMRDKYFIETWGLTVNFNDDVNPIGYGQANTWALSTEYAHSRHGAYTNSQRMLTPGHIGGGDTMHSGGGVTGTEFFQFPENGLYRIYMSLSVYADSTDGTKYIRPYVNNAELGRFYTSSPGVNHYCSAAGEVIVKISDYVNDTFYLYFYSISSGDRVEGIGVANNWYESHITFQRLGDIPS